VEYYEKTVVEKMEATFRECPQCFFSEHNIHSVLYHLVNVELEQHGITPAEGLYEIVAHEHLKLDEVAHFTINTIPDQGTETVRTEEALYATLACLGLLVSEA